MLIKIKDSPGRVSQIKQLIKSIYIFWQIMPSSEVTLDQGCQTRGPANTRARIFKDIDVKQSGNESLIKILSLVRGVILNLKV
jgi:hypothetical protein